jgi:hypothetical protein
MAGSWVGSPAGSLVPGGSMEARGLGMGEGAAPPPPPVAGADPEAEATGVPGTPGKPGFPAVVVVVGAKVGMGMVGGAAVVATGCVSVAVAIGGGVGAMGGGGSSSFLEQAARSAGATASSSAVQTRSVVRMEAKLSLRAVGGHAFLGV